MSGRTMVLGGGGVAGIAWMTGLLLGLAEAGADLRGADRMIGTSAGATVAAQLGSGVALPMLYARQVDPSLQPPELMPAPGLFDRFLLRITALIEAGDAAALLREMGRLALEAETVDEPARRRVIEARLPSPDWPAQAITIVAVDAQSGETRLFDRDGDVGLVDAVAASCAVPGVWPPVSIDGRRLVDGGIRSTDNLDLAAGAERVVVIAPRGTRLPFVAGRRLIDQVERLQADGTRVMVIEPDKGARTAIGSNPLDPSTRAACAEAGRLQGGVAAAAAAGFWTG